MNQRLPFGVSRIPLCALLLSLLPCYSALAQRPTPTPSGSIGDTVFCDFNRDGIQEGGEPGLAGVKVTLTGVHVTETAFTDANGKYLFTNLRAGKYTVSVDPSTAPPGCNVILPNCPLSITLSLSPGQALLDNDFCFGTNGTIGDTVFCDLNRDGVQEPGEPGLEGVTVTLRGDNITETATTDGNGNYLFTGLPPGTYTVAVDPTTAPPGCNVILPNCPLTRTVDLALGQIYLDADFCFGQLGCVDGVIGGVNLNGLANDYLFFFGNGSQDANWQGATKGFAGNVLLDGILASERTSGSVSYAGTIVTNDTSLSAWQSIVNQNAGQAFGSLGNTALVATSKTTLVNAIKQINAMTVTPGYESRSSTSLNNLNTQNGVAETFVINVTSGFQVTSQINITGDTSDVFILRWDTDANPANGYQGQVKFQSGGAIVPHGGLAASNFIHVAGDLNASGGGGNPPAPYPQGPRLNNGTGQLINGGTDWKGGGFFTGYWLTTGAPTTLDPSTGLYTGNTAPFSNAIFVGGWYTCTNKFSMTSGTSGVYVQPNCP
ncbi:MAG: SdrD B-like domain-containing protein [Chthoniobacterales bacterium]